MTVALTGVTAIDATWEVVSRAAALLLSKLARIEDVPGAVIAVASPFEPEVLPTVAILGLELIHDANVVKSWTVLLPSVPRAENCNFVCGAMLGGAEGVTVIDETGEMVIAAVPVTPEKKAEIVVEP